MYYLEKVDQNLRIVFFDKDNLVKSGKIQFQGNRE